MAAPFSLTSLTPREAVADALARCLIGLDSNDRPLFESACLKTEEMVFDAGATVKLEGFSVISDFIERIFHLITTHVTTNIRVELKSEDTAYLTCGVVSYHVRPENKSSVEETSYTGTSLYAIDLVRDKEDGLWKIKNWKVNILRTTGDSAIVMG